MSLLRSLIACQDWLSTDRPLLTELLATAQTREDASPVRGEIFVGVGHFDHSQAPSGATSGLPNNFRAVLTGSPSPLLRRGEREKTLRRSGSCHFAVYPTDCSVCGQGRDPLAVNHRGGDATGVLQHSGKRVCSRSGIRNGNEIRP